MSKEPDGIVARRPWHAGPIPNGSGWLALNDDELLHCIEMLPHDHSMDEPLLTVIQSERHFFIRQEAAKKVRDARLLMGSANDRHVGQILARRMSRIEDVEYLKHLVAESHHLDVRKAAQAQLKALHGHLREPSGDDPPESGGETPRARKA